ncbi:MAG: hydrogenase maturation nickel metallochaperone HypA [Candidatus Nitronauta litoralis]|uniref:Hydrogenase maturation nickel metallochaperone HypA n=1 Tax=Candidatus Nitronauta litoralis TaxID=2705533 RepID=A0A7T0G090_9BACT|nr:MAG: hydrogenase maturation nickel metallochaperone HypA [Candidatus Nitronauta litoralis]
MHEQSLMKDLMEKITSVSANEQNKPVDAVTVRLGALSHISADHFREHFAEASRGTIAENANLKIIVLDDINDPLAQEIILESIEIAE